MEVADNRKNFGFVKRGAVITNKYIIKNSGSTPLVITDAEVSCSCTNVQLPKQPVLPGRSDTVYVIFNTATVYGRQDRFAVIHSNSPGKPVRLRYKGVVSSK
jgi:hypothetical protein